MKLNIIFLISVAFFHNLGIGLVYPIFSSLLFSENELIPSLSHLSYGDRGGLLGLLLGIAPFVQCIVAPWIGRCSDIYGRKPVLVLTSAIGVLGYILGTLSLYGEISLTKLILSRIIIGISSANLSVVNAALSDMVGESERSKIFTWFGFAYGSGFTVGPFFGGFLNHPPLWFRSYFPYFSNISFLRPFIAASILTTLGVLFLSLTFTETLKTGGIHDAPLVQKERTYLFLKRIKNARIVFFLASTFLFCFGWSFYWEMIAAVWVHIEQIGPDQVGNRYAYGALCYTILAISVVQYLTTQVRDTILFILGSIILAISIFSTRYIEDYCGSMWIIPVQQFGIALLYPSSLANISRYATREFQGIIMGFHNSMISLGFALSPFSAWFFLSIDPYAPIYIGSFFLGLSLIAFITGLKSKSPNIDEEVISGTTISML